MNGITGAGVARALVSVNSQATLTDREGRFQLLSVTGTRFFVSASKPGYSATDDAGSGEAMRALDDPSSPIEVRLYPDAVITGTLNDREGHAVPRVRVDLLRAIYDASGVHGATVASTNTDTDGHYRFLQPTGKYRVVAPYEPRLFESEFAMLPAETSDRSPLEDAGYFYIGPGGMYAADLRVSISQTQRITLHLLDLPSGMLPRVTAKSRGGASFNVSLTRAADSSVAMRLPSGSYTLTASLEVAEQIRCGSTSLVVSRGDSVGELRLEEGASLPVEVRAAPTLFQAGTSSTSKNQPREQVSPGQLNLQLHRLETSDGLQTDQRLRVQPDGTASFHIVPGRYRLETVGSGSWYVQAANYGGTDALHDELVVVPGAAAAPLQVIASMDQGLIELRARSSEADAGGWVYLFPKLPSLTPVYSFRVHTGTATTESVPPGSYVAVGFLRRPLADVRDAATVARLSAHGEVVEITAGAKVAVEVDLASVLAESR